MNNTTKELIKEGIKEGIKVTSSMGIGTAVAGAMLLFTAVVPNKTILTKICMYSATCVISYMAGYKTTLFIDEQFELLEERFGLSENTQKDKLETE